MTFKITLSSSLGFENGEMPINFLGNSNAEIPVWFGETTEIVTNDYNNIMHKPSINNVTLIGNKTSDELYLQDKMNVITNLELFNILQ